MDETRRTRERGGGWKEVEWEGGGWRQEGKKRNPRSRSESKRGRRVCVCVCGAWRVGGEDQAAVLVGTTGRTACFDFIASSSFQLWRATKPLLAFCPRWGGGGRDTVRVASLRLEGLFARNSLVGTVCVCGGKGQRGEGVEGWGREGRGEGGKKTRIARSSTGKQGSVRRNR